jgi:hypothetical protein
VIFHLCCASKTVKQRKKWAILAAANAKHGATMSTENSEFGAVYDAFKTLKCSYWHGNPHPSNGAGTGNGYGTKMSLKRFKPSKPKRVKK